MTPQDFLSFAELLTDPLLLVEGGGRILSANQAAAYLLSAGGDLTGRSVADLLLEPSDKVEDYLRRCSRTRSPVPGVFTWQTGNGHAVPSRLEGATLDPRSGEQTARLLLRSRPREEATSSFGLLNERLSALAREIRERRRVEALLSAEREWFRVTLSSLGDGVIATDQAGVITFMNPVAERLTGWSIEEARGMRLDEVFSLVNEETGEPMPITALLAGAKGSERLPSHAALRRRDGSICPVGDSAAPIRDARGKILGMALVFRDISERRAAERAMLQLAAIVQSSEDAIISKDLNGIVRTWNPAAERIYGYPAEEMIGRSIALLLPRERQDEETEILQRLQHGDLINHFETERVRKDGRTISVSLTISPVRDKSGRIVGASHVARDITERLLLEEQLRQTQKYESLGVLAGGVAHDFNNLLTGVLGNASLALDYLEPGEPVIRPLLESVALAAERAADLTRQMLAYAGRGQFIIAPVNLTTFIPEIARLLNASVPKSVQLRFEMSEDLPVVQADPGQVQQIIMNLVINAAESIGEGRSGTVRIVTTVESGSGESAPGELVVGQLAPGKYVSLAVADNGGGMTPETMARIFDPFFSTKFTGRGLGLAAVAGIMRSHGGAIRVCSRPGAGSTFTVLFPIAAAATALSHPTAA